MNQGERAVNKVEDAIDEATEPEHPRKYATTDEPASGAMLATEQRRETEDIGIMGTDGQRTGLLVGGAVGGLIGGLLFLPFGFISWGADIGPGMRFVTCAVIGILVGATAGAVYWGGRVPELEGETVNADNSPGGGTSMRDPRTDDRGRPTEGTDDGRLS
jgi:hypothetical protein